MGFWDKSQQERAEQEITDFQKEWPISRLEGMTIEEYTNLDKNTSFTYWLESRTDSSGSIWGGSAFKFGIYKRKSTENTRSDEWIKTDGNYYWYTKYGDSPDEAFQKVKSIIISIAKASEEGRFEDIDTLDFGNAIKWKIAFHYNPTELIPIFNREVLALIASSFDLDKTKFKRTSYLQRNILKHKPPNFSTIEYASELWNKFNSNNFFWVIEKFLKHSDTDSLKREGFPKTFSKLDVKVSFGVGNIARIPWIALLKSPNTVTDGIYPVYLYYKEDNILILAYGVSETNISKYKWPNEDGLTTISTWFKNNLSKKPERYGSSYIKAVYSLINELDPDQIQKDLGELIDDYNSLTFPATLDEPETAYEIQSPRYWIIAPGEGARKWEDFYNEGLIGIGWDDVGDLKNYDSKKSIKEILNKLLPEGSESQMNNSLALWEFANVIRIGDILIPKRGVSEYLGYGIVIGDYYFDNNQKEYKHLRKVEWKKKGQWPEEVGPIVTKTLTDITKYPDYVNRLKRLIGIEQDAVIPESINYWWINANPKYWRISEFGVGQEQTYTTHNENGNKRNKFEYFQKVNPGDLIIGYESSPIKKIVAVFEVTRGAYTDEDDGKEKISFIIQKFLPEPIKWEELSLIPELTNAEVLKNNQGSLFKLTKEEFNAILNRDFLKISVVDEYTKEEALKDLFVDGPELDKILSSLKYKKNIILKGPPGTGKTYMARRLAYLMMEEKDNSKVETIQFHQSYSYEDFMQGYRPKEDGSFKLTNGVFYRFCKRAQSDPSNNYFFIIDEINRGNLSKIFGELMLLIESDKRGEAFAIPLTYSQSDDIKFFIPKNLFFIGTMNTADRSLALVDYALRRRFAFINITPQFGQKFKNSLIDNGVDEGIVARIQYKLTALNDEISKDPNLGEGFLVGHSYFCNIPDGVGDEEWYLQIIRNEIVPLLEEYWFDKDDKAKLEGNRLRS